MRRRDVFKALGAAVVVPAGRSAPVKGEARVEPKIVRLKLRHTWTTVMSSSDYRDTVHVRYTRGGITGVGEGAPIVRYPLAAADLRNLSTALDRLCRLLFAAGATHLYPSIQGFPVLRSEATKTREFNPRAYRVYGPKLIATRGYFEDRALESRCLTEEMGQAKLRDDIPINLPPCHNRRTNKTTPVVRKCTGSLHGQAPSGWRDAWGFASGERARALAAKRGLRYQTYLKMLLHEALAAEEKKLTG